MALDLSVVFLRDGNFFARWECNFIHCGMKLPNLKLTKRTVGSKSTSTVHRGMGTTSPESATSIDSSEARDEISEGFTEDARFTEEASEPLCASSDLDLPVSDDEPTNYEL